MLETVFGAFDEIAKRRRVFKVETVGDCYVAVTGLPDPMKDHAVALCRFARDCMRKTEQLFHQLTTQLGPDTEELMLRVGLHSGPVTAGKCDMCICVDANTAAILWYYTLQLMSFLYFSCHLQGVIRSDKSRFQLFGDTMNTGKLSCLQS